VSVFMLCMSVFILAMPPRHSEYFYVWRGCNIGSCAHHAIAKAPNETDSTGFIRALSSWALCVVVFLMRKTQGSFSYFLIKIIKKFISAPNQMKITSSKGLLPKTILWKFRICAVNRGWDIIFFKLQKSSTLRYFAVLKKMISQPLLLAQIWNFHRMVLGNKPLLDAIFIWFGAEINFLIIFVKE
jgi:hypothetical protein